jgi:hypothetical protein
MKAEAAPKLNGRDGLEQALKALMRTLTWTTFESQVDDLKVDNEIVKECALRVAAIVYDYTGYKFTWDPHSTHLRASLTITSRFREESVNKRLSVSTVWLACL